MKRLGKSRKGSEEKEPITKEEPLEELRNDEVKNDAVDSTQETEEDDDDDFITNEVKRQLKELRNKRFMVLIPEAEEEEEEEDEEESCLEYEEEDTSSSEWRESAVEVGYPWCGFDGFYDKYCECMLFFDKMSIRLLQEAGSRIPSNLSPRSASKKLASTLRSLSFKRRELQDDGEPMQQPQDDPLQDLETAYVAQICLTWEALHCQYTYLSHKIALHPENATWYSHAAQQFQQFLVLLQRFIENEPFEQGNRVDIFARNRISLPKLLQVPIFQGSDQKEQEEEESDHPVLATELFRVIESSIMTFCLFLKMDKKKSGSVGNLFGGNGHAGNSFQQMLTSINKKKIRLKDLQNKKKGWKKKSWPTMAEEVELLFGLIDIKVISRVLRMRKVSKEQLLWCEEKMCKLDVSGNKLKRDGLPVLFPC